jgi:hypothetical protein
MSDKPYISPLTGKPCKSKPALILKFHRHRVRNRKSLAEKQRIYRENHPNHYSGYTKNNPEKFAVYSLEWRTENPQKKKAENKSRAIPLQKQCEQCASTKKLERHHPDYSKPLEVKTLCRKCHYRANREQRNN